MEECEIFYNSLSIRGFSELNPRIHTSSAGYNSICSSDKKNSKIAKDQEHRFRGRINLIANVCIVSIISDYSLALAQNDDDMIYGFL